MRLSARRSLFKVVPLSLSHRKRGTQGLERVVVVGQQRNGNQKRRLQALSLPPLRR